MPKRNKPLSPVSKISGLIFVGAMLLLVKPFFAGQKPAEHTLASIQETPKSESQIDTCQIDQDCIAMIDECCACDQGGKKRAINRKYYSYWLDKQADGCYFTHCPSYESTDLTCTKLEPKCVNNRCQMK